LNEFRRDESEHHAIELSVCAGLRAAVDWLQCWGFPLPCTLRQQAGRGKGGQGARGSSGQVAGAAKAASAATVPAAASAAVVQAELDALVKAAKAEGEACSISTAIEVPQARRRGLRSEVRRDGEVPAHFQFAAVQPKFFWRGRRRQHRTDFVLLAGKHAAIHRRRDEEGLRGAHESPGCRCSERQNFRSAPHRPPTAISAIYPCSSPHSDSSKAPTSRRNG